LNIKTLCLGFLSTRAATGYEIKKDFEEGLFSHFIEASFGSIYPALNQLAADGLVTVREEEQTGRPDKKIYSITEKGHAALGQWLAVIPARDKYKSEFLFQMLLQHYIAPADRVASIESHLSHLRADLKSIEDNSGVAPDNEGCCFVMGYGRAILTSGIAYLEKTLKEMTSRKAAAAE
jgi:DNA-binding PadR family transcriptional regulator